MRVANHSIVAPVPAPSGATFPAAHDRDGHALRYDQRGAILRLIPAGIGTGVQKSPSRL